MTVDVKKYNFGIVGYGFLGTAVAHGFGLHADIKIYDKFMDYDSLEDVVEHAEVIWICLPTPMNIETGEIDLGIIEENLEKINLMVKPEDKKIIVIKSTVVPGSTRKFAERYQNLHFTMNPEFLTARNNRLDFICASRIIIGSDEEWISDRMEEIYRYRFGNSTPIYRCGWEAAELTKYGANCFFAVKISYFNYIHSLCEHLGLEFDEVRDMILSDGRIGRSHANVPGWDGQKGYSGACLASDSMILTNKGPKDISEVTTNDMLYNSDGFTSVSKIGSRYVNEVIEIKARGRKLVGSLDHIHMVKSGDELIQKQLQHIRSGEWVYMPRPKINTLDTVIMGPKPKIKSLEFWLETVKLNKSITRIMGLFVGDGFSGVYGSNKNEYSVNWTFGMHEEHLADEVVGTLDTLGIRATKRHKVSKNATYGKSEVWNVRVRSLWLYSFFNKVGLGHKSFDKGAPLLDGELAEGFISGWLDADGSYYKKTGTISGFSRSKKLIKMIDIMLLNMGICAFIKKDGQEINISTKNDVRRVSAWMSSDRFLFQDNYVRKNAYASPTMKVFKDGWAVKVKSVSILNEPTKVYSVETNSGLYTANMFLTHNCFPKDMNALINYSREQGLDPLLLQASWAQNLEDRPSKDWEGIKSAVSKKDGEK